MSESANLFSVIFHAELPFELIIIIHRWLWTFVVLVLVQLGCLFCLCVV